ncbi:MAG TPA: trigger factor [Nitriliruptorales bacterium]|nr:trigger factor [Nitriliruptorales bacterium]
MKTTLEQLEPTRVKLTVEVEPDRVTHAFDDAAHHLAQQVQIKGFRKGKAPRRLLEARLGKDAILQHAVEEWLGRFYAEAVRQEDLSPVAPPEIDLETFTEDEGCVFAATVEIRPEVELPDHTGIQMTFPDWDVTDEQVREQVEALRERFAELEVVERPAARGDFVTIDLLVFQHGEPLESATAEDALYEVGSGGVTPELDEQLPGAATGHILNYTDRLPDGYPEHGGEEVEFRVLVKDVRAKRLPDLDDDFAATASEFDSLEELQHDIRRGLRSRRLSHARQELRARVLEAYLALVDVPLPEAMVTDEVEGRLARMRRQAEQYGVELDQLLQMQGTDLDTARRELEEQARQAVKAQLVLEALAREVGLTVEPGDLDREVRRHAADHGIEPAQLAQVISEQGSVGVLVGDVARRKALDLLVEAAEVEGAPSDDVLEELGLAPSTSPDDDSIPPAEPAEGAAQHA